jgi:hypothetical protein
MPKNKKKANRKVSKKSAAPARKMRKSAPARKKKPAPKPAKKSAKKQGRKSGETTIEFEEIEVISGIDEDAVDEIESIEPEPLDEHFPPEYGGSE